MLSLSADKAEGRKSRPAPDLYLQIWPYTTVSAVVLTPQTGLQNGRWPQYLPRVSRHPCVHFQLLLSHLLSCIWKPWMQRVAESPFTSLSSHLQPHSPTCLSWHWGKEWSSPTCCLCSTGGADQDSGLGSNSHLDLGPGTCMKSYDLQPNTNKSLSG